MKPRKSFGLSASIHYIPLAMVEQQFFARIEGRASMRKAGTVHRTRSKVRL